MHSPIFGNNKRIESLDSSDVTRNVGNFSLLPGELSVKLAGVEYPLHEKAIKELQMPRLGLFSTNKSKYWYIFLSYRENLNIIESNEKA